jgi:hypothetical protein
LYLASRKCIEWQLKLHNHLPITLPINFALPTLYNDDLDR